MPTPFENKRALILFPTGEGDYQIRFDPLKGHFKELYLFNFPEYALNNGIKNTERHITALLAARKIDIVFLCPFATEHWLSVEFVHALRERVNIVFWFSDDGAYFDVYGKYYGQASDVVVTADPFAVSGYSRYGIPVILSNEISLNSHFRPLKVEKDIDVCFIGDMRKRGRREYIDYLLKNGINVVVYGRGSGNGYLPNDKMSEYLCRSKINLNFSQIGQLDWSNCDEPMRNLLRQSTGRPREIALTRSFCLSEYSPALNSMFAIGRELDMFRDKEELLEKVKYYLSQPHKREELARAAYARAVKEYRPVVFTAKMLDAIGASLADPTWARIRPGTIYLADGFKVKAINSLTFSLFSLMKRGRIKYAAEVFSLLFKYGPLIFLRGFLAGTLRALGHIFRGPGKALPAGTEAK